jgi:hypothetical protein
LSRSPAKPNVPTKQKKAQINLGALKKHKARFLKFFPEGFADERYIAWERTYKWKAHELFMEHLSKSKCQALLRSGAYSEIANRALQVEGKTNFIFSFQKMALRDGVRSPRGAQLFAEGLFALLYTKAPLRERFAQWIVNLSEMPVRQSRILSWPVATFFPFIAQPKNFIILKPTAMKAAALALDFDLDYTASVNFTTYDSLLTFAGLVSNAIADLRPKDFHDIQSFLWTIGSAEYERLEEELKEEGLW